MMESIENNNCILAEGPIWNTNEQVLYWTDIYGMCIWKYNPASRSAELAWQGNHMVGGFAFTVDNDIVVCTEKGIFKIFRSNDSFINARMEKLYDIPMEKGERFNDITTDPAGRILAGTLKESQTDGVLYKIEQGKEPVKLLEGLGISNGMTFSLYKLN